MTMTQNDETTRMRMWRRQETGNRCQKGQGKNDDVDDVDTQGYLPELEREGEKEPLGSPEGKKRGY